MDALDVAIIRAMGIRPYERVPKPLDALRPARLARATRASVNTVKERIAAMTEAGVIAGYRAFPNLRHLGLAAEAHYLEFPGEEAKDAALPQVKSLHGILEVHDFIGPGLCADFSFRDEADRRAKLDLLTGLARGAPLRTFYVREMPPVKRGLTALDWRVLGALRADPRAGAADLAEAVGVSARTVKRHLTRMAAEGSVFLVPVVDPSKVEGLFVFELLVYLHDGSGPRPMAALRAAFQAEHVYAYVPASAELGHYDLLLFARTSAQVEELRRRAETVPGVARAEAWLFRAFLDLSVWLDDAVAERTRE